MTILITKLTTITWYEKAEQECRERFFQQIKDYEKYYMGRTFLVEEPTPTTIDIPYEDVTHRRLPEPVLSVAEQNRVNGEKFHKEWERKIMYGVDEQMRRMANKYKYNPLRLNTNHLLP